MKNLLLLYFGATQLLQSVAGIFEIKDVCANAALWPSRFRPFVSVTVLSPVNPPPPQRAARRKRRDDNRCVLWFICGPCVNGHDCSQVLDYFDFLFKVDNDVVFTQPMPSIGQEMAENDAWLLHTAQLTDPPAFAKSSKATMQQYVALQSLRCGYPVAPVSQGERWFERETTVWFGNFIGIWLGLLQSPEIMAFAHTFTHVDMGKRVFLNRWTDQQYWPKAFGLAANRSHLLDRTLWRQDKWFLHKTCCKRGERCYCRGRGAKGAEPP